MASSLNQVIPEHAEEERQMSWHASGLGTFTAMSEILPCCHVCDGFRQDGNMSEGSKAKDRGNRNIMRIALMLICT